MVEERSVVDGRPAVLVGGQDVGEVAQQTGHRVEGPAAGGQVQGGRTCNKRSAARVRVHGIYNWALRQQRQIIIKKNHDVRLSV